MLNMEPYGYNDGTYVADREMLIEWLNDAGGTGTRTLHYSLAILSVLLLRIEGTSNATHESLEAAYRNRELLEDTLDRTVYFNIRSTSNERKEQDFAAIAGVGHQKLVVSSGMSLRRSNHT